MNSSTVNRCLARVVPLHEYTRVEVTNPFWYCDARRSDCQPMRVIHDELSVGGHNFADAAEEYLAAANM